MSEKRERIYFKDIFCKCAYAWDKILMCLYRYIRDLDNLRTSKEKFRTSKEKYDPKRLPLAVCRSRHSFWIAKATEVLVALVASFFLSHIDSRKSQLHSRDSH